MTTQALREQMVAQQVRAWDVLDLRVLDLLMALPRERFVPTEWRGVAFADTAIPLAHGQHMLPPKVVGRILQALELRGDEGVLEIGTGSGYLTAGLAALAREVRTIEIFGDLVETARENLEAAGIGNATVEFADGSKLDEHDAYDVVVLTAALPLYDSRFERALRIGGRLFVIVGEPPIMEARLVRRVGASAFATQSLFETLVEPLLHARRPDRFHF